MVEDRSNGLIIERILRDRDGIWRQVVEERGLGRLTVRMLGTSAICLALYGAVLGASHSFAQAGSSAVKLPLLFLATLAICLPTLYLFNLIFGAKLTMMQAIVVIMVCITVIAVLTLAFAPISLFFLITANNYEFFKLLNVSILILSAIVGLRFLTAGMTALNEYQQMIANERARVAAEAEAALAGAGAPTGVEAAAAVDGGAWSQVAALPKAPTITLPAQGGVRFVEQGPTLPAYKPMSNTLLYIWILLFGFVGTQLAWTLRPFFGSPHEPFQIFRNISGTFYTDIFRTIGNLIGG
jgi:hypothetical protein